MNIPDELVQQETDWKALAERLAAIARVISENAADPALSFDHDAVLRELREALAAYNAARGEVIE